VLYGDTHAGRGKYQTGDPGSPVVALQTLLAHGSRDQLLSKSELNFLFIERDPGNVASLQQELAALGTLPPRINVEISEDDAFEKLSTILKELHRDQAVWRLLFCSSIPTASRSPRNCSAS
jgi:three-Cys-motif partner protein